MVSRLVRDVCVYIVYWMEPKLLPATTVLTLCKEESEIRLEDKVICEKKDVLQLS